ncbi:hypothetical protein OUZ56_009204 [Daphnia magna]|uniref:Uncharacterized protein n=1 Tax=Daphnia magna TaxID=35525 RepID=A0ABR0AF97_9CRUS|nr:hypothetical protein OUZ56_009204 [Daphnia magna]
MAVGYDVLLRSDNFGRLISRMPTCVGLYTLQRNSNRERNNTAAPHTSHIYNPPLKEKIAHTKKFLQMFRGGDSGSSIEAYHSPFSLCFKKEGAKLYKFDHLGDYT